MSSDNKIDCKGIFTGTYAWAFPTSIRVWRVVVTLCGLQESAEKISISISSPNGRPKVLMTEQVVCDTKQMGNVLARTIAHQFRVEGIHHVGFAIVGRKEHISVPLIVKTRPWPKFSAKDLAALRKSTTVPKSIRATINCLECSQPFVFEATPLPDFSFAPKVLPFPKGGRHECEACSHTLFLKDLEGQLLESIKSALVIHKGGE